MNEYNGDLILYVGFGSNFGIVYVEFNDNFYCYVVIDVKGYI